LALGFSLFFFPFHFLISLQIKSEEQRAIYKLRKWEIKRENPRYANERDSCSFPLDTHLDKRFKLEAFVVCRNEKGFPTPLPKNANKRFSVIQMHSSEDVGKPNLKPTSTLNPGLRTM
jgi:hypothetical protein